jgi:beta-aspartyl-peptidase (threonine type)
MPAITLFIKMKNNRKTLIGNLPEKYNMKKLLLLFSLFFFEKALAQPPRPQKTFVLVIHGGAGTILKSQMTPAKEKAYTDALNDALDKGSAILKNGGTALDAVEASVKALEDNPLFNAGKGTNWMLPS